MPSFKSRFKLLIYPRFQLSLIVGNSVLMLTVLASCYWSVNKSFERLLLDGKAAGLSEGHAYFKLLDYQFDLIAKNLFIAFVIGGIFSTVWMLLLSNKVAGPIVRLRSYFASLTKDNYKEVNFRKNDFFTDLPPVINHSLTNILTKSE